MRAVSSATSRQIRILAPIDKGRQRNESENQHQDNGEAATHLSAMLANNRLKDVT